MDSAAALELVLCPGLRLLLGAPAMDFQLAAASTDMACADANVSHSNGTNKAAAAVTPTLLDIPAYVCKHERTGVRVWGRMRGSGGVIGVGWGAYQTERRRRWWW